MSKMIQSLPSWDSWVLLFKMKINNINAKGLCASHYQINHHAICSQGLLTYISCDLNNSFKKGRVDIVPFLDAQRVEAPLPRALEWRGGTQSMFRFLLFLSFEAVIQSITANHVKQLAFFATSMCGQTRRISFCVMNHHLSLIARFSDQILFILLETRTDVKKISRKICAKSCGFSVYFIFLICFLRCTVCAFWFAFGFDASRLCSLFHIFSTHQKTNGFWVLCVYYLQFFLLGSPVTISIQMTISLHSGRTRRTHLVISLPSLSLPPNSMLERCFYIGGEKTVYIYQRNQH